MMLDTKIIDTQKDIFKYFPFGILIGSIFLSEILIVVNEAFQSNPYLFSQNSYFNWCERLDSFTEMQAIGQVLYTQYVLQFLIAGNILLLATIAAVVLTINTDLEKGRKQVIFKQLSRNYKNVLVI